jgi:hypothetical protein
MTFELIHAARSRRHFCRVRDARLKFCRFSSFSFFLCAWLDAVSPWYGFYHLLSAESMDNGAANITALREVIAFEHAANRSRSCGCVSLSAYGFRYRAGDDVSESMPST